LYFGMFIENSTDKADYVANPIPRAGKANRRSATLFLRYGPGAR